MFFIDMEHFKKSETRADGKVSHGSMLSEHVGSHLNSAEGNRGRVLR